MEPLRIAMLGVKSVPAAGGIARYVEELGSHLAQRGHEITVYCRKRYLDDPACSPYRGIRRKLSPGLSGKHLDAATHVFSAAVDCLWRDYDIVHIHGLAPGFVTPLLRLLSRKRIVLTVHATDWQGAKWGALARQSMKLAARLSLALSHEVTAVSLGLQEMLQQERGCHVFHTPPGSLMPVPQEPKEILEHGIKPDRYILCVARLTPEKGVHYAVEAFEQIVSEPEASPELQDCQLVVAGDCPYGSEYAGKLKARASERIKFVSYASGRFLQELYSNAYLYLQPSDLEGLSVALLEAMSYGRCVLASDIPQNQECLGGHGYTFRAGSVASLKERLAWILANPEAVAREAAPAREYVAREFNWDHTTDRFEEVYAACLAPRKRRGVGDCKQPNPGAAPPVEGVEAVRAEKQPRRTKPASSARAK